MSDQAQDPEPAPVVFDPDAAFEVDGLTYLPSPPDPPDPAQPVD